MRKAVLAMLAVLCSVGTADEEIEKQVLTQKDETEQTALAAGCSGGGSSGRTSRRGRRGCTECTQSELAKCGRKRNADKEPEADALLAAKCKGGNCNRDRTGSSLV